MLNKRFTCNDTDLEIRQSDLIIKLVCRTEVVFERLVSESGTIENGLKACKHEARQWTTVKRLCWKKELLCPECKAIMRYFPTDYGDYFCEKCRGAWTQFGTKAIKHRSGRLVA